MYTASRMKEIPVILLSGQLVVESAERKAPRVKSSQVSNRLPKQHGNFILLQVSGKDILKYW
jgi:hypothetical protein